MLDYSNKTIGYLRVDAMIQPPNGKRTEYRATATCCNTVITICQDQIQRVNFGQPECCVNCYKARRASVVRESRNEQIKRPHRARTTYQTYKRVSPEVAEAAAVRRSETRKRLERIAAGRLPTAAGGGRK